MTDDEIVEAMARVIAGWARDYSSRITDESARRCARAALSVARPMIEAQRSWTLGDTERAHCFLVKHGRSVEPSCEPGADRWRDDLAAEFAAARRSGKRAGAEYMRERVLWKLRRQSKIYAEDGFLERSEAFDLATGYVCALPLEG